MVDEGHCGWGNCRPAIKPGTGAVADDGSFLVVHHISSSFFSCDRLAPFSSYIRINRAEGSEAIKTERFQREKGREDQEKEEKKRKSGFFYTHPYCAFPNSPPSPSEPAAKTFSFSTIQTRLFLSSSPHFSPLLPRSPFLTASSPSHHFRFIIITIITIVISAFWKLPQSSVPGLLLVPPALISSR